MFTSQHGEDKFMTQFFDNEYKGVCIEVGAYDGKTLSNTYYFEQKGWNCLCIEPIQSAFKECTKIRKNAIQCCIGEKDSENKEFKIYHLNTNLCAISSLVPDERLVESHKHLITNVSTQSVAVRSLTSLLNELNFPKSIDFISIDTENTELDVLKSIDFSIYSIKYFIIENNYNEPFCEDYLKQFGYKKIYRLAVNDFYVKE
jgi:FkbM family methyltransferase